MARGSEKKYTSKQKRTASKIERGYKKGGVSSKEAERPRMGDREQIGQGWAEKRRRTARKKRNKSSSRKGRRKGGR
jgi:hypothetical protein